MEGEPSWDHIRSSGCDLWIYAYDHRGCHGKKDPHVMHRSFWKPEPPLCAPGLAAALIPVIIAPYYCVIGGWVVKYFVEFVRGNGMAVSSDTYFGDFISRAGSGDPGKSAALVRDLCAPYGSGGAPGR